MTMERSQARAGDWTQVYAYFADLCRHLSYATDPPPTPAREAREQAPAALFWLLTQRNFTYLTRKRCEPYRESVETYLWRAIDQGQPVRLYYDIGGGYRASLQPGQLPPTFTPGLGEVFALSQVHRFVRSAQQHCPVPIRFTLVVDNLCARYVNGVPIAATHRYCAALRAVLRHFELTEVDLLVESEQVSAADYEQQFESALANTEPPEALTPAAHENVERFNGRRMAPDEARDHIARYAAGSSTTEAGLARIVDGVRMTQRATPETLAFRPFPGGDQRIQCGEVALAMRGDRVTPMLLSSANYEHYRSQWIDVAEWSIPHVDSIRLLY